AIDIRAQLLVGQRSGRAVLAFPDDRRAFRRALGPAVDAVVREVDRATGEPNRPWDAFRRLHDVLVRREELDSEILDDRLPEPRYVFLRTAHELGIRTDPERAHQTRDVRMLDVFRRRRPGEGLGHPPKAIGGRVTRLDSRAHGTRMRCA